MKNGMTRRGKLSPQMSRLWSAVCRKSELGHPKTPTPGAKIELLLKRADFPRWYCPPSWAFPRAGSSHYVNHLYGAIELKATVIPKEVGKHTVQMDELWYESRRQRE